MPARFWITTHASRIQHFSIDFVLCYNASMIEQNEKKQGKLVYYIIAITFLIIAVLSSLQVLVVKERAKKSVAASYEENCRRITDAYADVVSIRLSEYIKQMRMYTEADVTKTVDPVEIQSWLIEHASSRTVNNEIGGVVVGFNKFTEKLHSIVSDVKSSKETLEAAGEDLDASMQVRCPSVCRGRGTKNQST